MIQDLLQTAAFAPITDRGWLRVTGEDRTRWLNGMTTNNIAALQPGQGCYTFFLNAQGKIQADAYAFAQSDSILLETQIPQVLADLLDRFIIMDDVELEVVGSQSGIKSSEEESVGAPGHAASPRDLGCLPHPTPGSSSPAPPRRLPPHHPGTSSD